MVDTGKKVKNFKLSATGDKDISLSDFKGKNVVLYFYPKDSTPGCTTESCNLRDNYRELIKKGFEVIGVSADSEKSHQNFINAP